MKRLESRILIPPYVLFVGNVLGLTSYALGVNVEVDFDSMEIVDVGDVDRAARFPTTAALKEFIFSEVMAGTILFSPEVQNEEMREGGIQVVVGLPEDGDATTAAYEALNLGGLDIHSFL